jgi:hypothetical protein
VNRVAPQRDVIRDIAIRFPKHHLVLLEQGLQSGFLTDLADVVDQRRPPVGEVIGGTRYRQGPRTHSLGDRRRTRHELGHSFAHVPFLELVDTTQAVAAAQ